MGHPSRPREAASNIRHASSAPVAPPTPAERAVLQFLQKELLPDLEREHHVAAARGVHRALKSGTLQPLQSLSAGDKHDLLGTLEAKVGHSTRLGPSVVVKLIASLELTPHESDFEHRRAILPLR